MTKLNVAIIFFIYFKTKKIDSKNEQTSDEDAFVAAVEFDVAVVVAVVLVVVVAIVDEITFFSLLECVDASFRLLFEPKSA